jgi:large subunit ribosomal protein L30
MAPTPDKPESKALAGRAARRAKGPGPGKRIRVTQEISFIGFDARQRRVIAGLGLPGRPGRSVELEDTPSTRGMVAMVPHLVRIDEIDAEIDATTGKTKAEPARAVRKRAGGGSR